MFEPTVKIGEKAARYYATLVFENLLRNGCVVLL